MPRVAATHEGKPAGVVGTMDELEVMPAHQRVVDAVARGLADIGSCSIVLRSGSARDKAREG